MSFDSRYEDRFERIYKVAIENAVTEGERLKANRVDLSISGDSILTAISDGIAHSRLILADVSSMGRDSVTSKPYRNANVLYEVGMALAARHHSEVVLVRDDHDPFLFDVSVIPHRNIDFTDESAAVEVITSELRNRLQAQASEIDARIELAYSQLSPEEVVLLRTTGESAVFGWQLAVDHNTRLVSGELLARQRLVEKGILTLDGFFENGMPAYKATPLGLRVRDRMLAIGPTHKMAT